MFKLSFVSNSVRTRHTNVVTQVQTSAQQRVYWALKLINSHPSHFYAETFTDWGLMRQEAALMGDTKKKLEIIQSGQRLKPTAIRLKGG